MIEAFTPGSPHTKPIVITDDIESGFVAKDDLVPYPCSLVSSCAAPFQKEVSTGVSRAAHVMGPEIANVLHPSVFIWFEKTQGPLLKGLPVPGGRSMKQLAANVQFL
ncbi:uncharacterized protein TNCV_4119641 [Trichonephila clavipes]|nr:uncharacterized protein TNCV_4119641 [Trichonephila clavipes]